MTINLKNVVAARRLGLAAGAAAAAVAVGVGTTSPVSAAQSVSASVANDTLTVTGSGGGDRIALRLQAGVPGMLQVDFGDDASAEFTFDRATFSQIKVFARGGSDQFRVDQINGVFADELATIDGGSGHDKLDGGNGNEVFVAGSGGDAVDGNGGSDTAFLGSGNDSFRWDPGDGSDIVEGQSGTDTLDFNGAAGVENMSLSPDGKRSLFLRDAGNIRMDMDNVERLDLTTLGSVDTVRVDDMSGTDLRRADIDLSGPAGGGDGAADIVTVNGTAKDDEVDVESDGARVEIEGLTAKVRITGSETIDSLQVNTLDGDDEVDVGDDVVALVNPIVDLGPGQN